MPFRFLSEKHGKLRGVINILLYAFATALVTLSLATVISGSQADLAARVDRNVQVARSGVDTVVCILLIEPSARTDAAVQDCAVDHGYHYTPPNEP